MATQLPAPTQEIRFAVVMYGGVSLAIYINGAAQELLRLVRSTSSQAAGLDSVELIYREMSAQVRSVRDPALSQPEPTRFVVDILSGTSAGGINAVFLAKALAIGAEDLSNLKTTWLNVADIDKLLNRKSADRPKRSLLNGNWMYDQLHKALDAMNRPPAGTVAPDIDRLDLFVTTTDLNGVPLPMRLTDMDIVEKIHKGFFHFRYDKFPLTGRANSTPEDGKLDEFRRDDFEPKFDPMLAFAARATSSFPVAFPPIKLADIKPIIGTSVYEKCKTAYLKFFTWIPASPLVRIDSPVDNEERELADGGYLNNKPFDHVVEALTFRPTRLPHSRKLLFVDPFPELAGDQKDKPHFDFAENALDAAMTLPRYQTIRQEIERIQELNRTLHRLDEIHVRAGSSPRRDLKIAYPQVTLAKLEQVYGPAYGAYHAVRLFDTTDDLARIVSGLHQVAADNDLFLAVRYLVRAWRDRKFSPEGVGGTRTETGFFADFDYSFRLRRLTHLLEWSQSQPNLALVCESLICQIVRLLRKREQLSSAPDVTISSLLGSLGTNLSWDRVKSVLVNTTDRERLDAAKIMYDRTPLLDKLADAIAAQWRIVFQQNKQELETLLADNPTLKEEYESFDFDDMLSLTFLEGSNVSEHTETEIYRISPADGTKPNPKDPVDLAKKLTGYKLADFGAFLHKDYRRNDMLFGRLDACERIVSAIFNRQEDEQIKNHYVQRLQRAIVEQELAAGMNALVPVAASNLPTPLALHNLYSLPEGPPPKDSARQVAQAAGILGQMFEDDLHTTNGFTSFLQIAGKFSAVTISFLAPRSLGSLFLKHWLALVALASLLLLAVGYVAKQSPIERIGAYGVGAVAVLALLAWLVGRILGKLTVPAWVRIPLASAFAALVVWVALSGFRHAGPDASLLLEQTKARFGEIWSQIAQSQTRYTKESLRPAHE